MNYLAHLFLSGTDNGLICGNFLADYVKNRDLEALPAPIQLGIQFHRRIDTFTDTHEVMRASNKILHPVYHKYAPVVNDLYCDYFLGKNWSHFTDESLTDFLQRIYRELTLGIPYMPDKLQGRLRQMISHNWLQSYTTLNGLSYAFLRMTERVHFPMDFSNAAEILIENQAGLEANFMKFFPELNQYARDFVCEHIDLQDQ